MTRMSILHITPHLGGGVGRVLLNYFTQVKGDRSFVHEVACLDYANKHALDVAENIGIELTDRMACNVHSQLRSEEHTSELQSRIRITYAVFCLKKKNNKTKEHMR